MAELSGTMINVDQGERMLLFRLLALCGMITLGGCAISAPHNTAASGSGIGTLLGDYNNYGEVWAAREAAKAGLVLNGVPPLVRNTLRMPARSSGTLLWRMIQEIEPQHEARWMYRIEGDSLVPYRPLTEAARAEVIDETATQFQYVAEDWAVLSSCAMHRQSRAEGLVYEADRSACSAMYPGLGADAALLPLRIESQGDSLRVSTVADQARGADAATTSRRLRTFQGWQAINGGGPGAGPDNKDWHVLRDLVLHNGGGRTPLRWRDQSPSGYSIELARLNYRESGAEVLRLSVTEDASGRIVSYVWADPGAQRIGLNLGWLQIGLEQVGTKVDANSR